VEQVVFDRRFRGPPESANGGYAAGVAARLLGRPASVRLRLPPPLDKPLRPERDDDRLLILDGDAPVIEATAAADLEIEVPEPVGIDEARRASERYGGFTTHPFPTCFVCGPERDDGDGLRVFPSPIDGREILAAPWTPTAEFADESGRVRPEFVWAALDCPGGWAVGQSSDTPSVLGTIAARELRDIRPDETYVAIAWPIGTEGRKGFVGSALFTGDGGLVAQALAVWIALSTG
jgi:hypothetical protein